MPMGSCAKLQGSVRSAGLDSVIQALSELDSGSTDTTASVMYREAASAAQIYNFGSR
jgi:hypothetical protein